MVVDSSQGPIFLLSGCVPEIELYTFAITIGVDLFEVGSSQSRREILTELVGDETGYETTFANTCGA